MFRPIIRCCGRQASARAKAALRGASGAPRAQHHAEAGEGDAEQGKRGWLGDG